MEAIQRITRFISPNIWQARLDTIAQVVADDLTTKPRPNVIEKIISAGCKASSGRLAQSEEHGCTDELPVKCQIDTAHGKEGTLRNCQDGIHVSSVPLSGLDDLRGSIVIWNIQPKAMRDCRGHTLSQAERVTADEVSAVSVGIIQSIEEEGGGRLVEVDGVAFQGVDEVSKRIRSRSTVTIQSKDVLFGGNQEAEGFAGMGRERGSEVRAEGADDVVARVEVSKEARGKEQRRRVITHDDEVKGLQDGAPRFQERPEIGGCGGDHNVHVLRGHHASHLLLLKSWVSECGVGGSPAQFL